MDSASYGDGEYTEDLMPIISDSIWTKIYSKVTFRVALILKKNYLWHLLLFFFPPKGMSSSHYKWECILAKNRIAESKLWDSIQASSVRFRKEKKNKNKEILFWLQILLKMLNNIPPQEVCFYIIQCQITGNFISRAPSMCRISRSHILCRKHFSLFFFLPLYRVIKKVKARCIKQKSAGQGAAAEGVPIPLILDQPVAPASSLSQASYTGGRGRGGSDCWYWGNGAVRGVCCPSSSPPIARFESAKTLFFGT